MSPYNLWSVFLFLFFSFLFVADFIIVLVPYRRGRQRNPSPGLVPPSVQWFIIYAKIPKSRRHFCFPDVPEYILGIDYIGEWILSVYVACRPIHVHFVTLDVLWTTTSTTMTTPDDHTTYPCVRVWFLTTTSDESHPPTLNVSMNIYSAWSAAAQRVGGSDKSDDDRRVLAAAARRTLERADRLLQVALCGGGPVGQRGHGHHAQPDRHGHRRAEEVDRVQGLGAGRNDCRRRAHLLSDHGAHPGRRYVSLLCTPSTMICS